MNPSKGLLSLLVLMLSFTVEKATLGWVLLVVSLTITIVFTVATTTTDIAVGVTTIPTTVTTITSTLLCIFFVNFLDSSCVYRN